VDELEAQVVSNVTARSELADSEEGASVVITHAKLAALKELNLSVSDAVAFGIDLGIPVVRGARPSSDIQDCGPQGLQQCSSSAIDGELDVLLGADDDEVEVGKVVSSQGKEIPLDEAFRRIQLQMRGAAIASCIIKEEPLEKGEEVIVPCTKLRFTQRACSGRFRCGRLLGETIEALVSGAIDPLDLRHHWLVLQVVRRGEKMLSVDNRRLYCLHKFQRHVHPREVLVRIRVYDWDPVFDRFLQHWDAAEGLSIHVRRSRPCR
jgi:hypothetical protein